MRVINWRDVLTRAKIPFVERGKNVGRGEINIHCPFCGSADPSHHMGLNMESGYWACWRNDQHRGKSPVRLLVALLKISVAKARELAGLDANFVDPDGFTAAVAKLLGRADSLDTAVLELDFPDTFRPLTSTGVGSRHARYLTDVRGFTDVNMVSKLYELCVDVGAAQRDRVIFPYIMEDKLVTWTGRAIADASIRYLDLSPEKSVVGVSKTLYNIDAADDPDCKALVVVEGQIDALKLDYYGRTHGVRAVGLGTNSISETQVMLLHDVAARVPHIAVMMDNASQLSIIDSVRMKAKLASIRNLRAVPVPFGAKDAAELLPIDVVDFCRDFVREL